MILAIAYNPQLRPDGRPSGSALLTCLALGTGIGHFLVLMGGTAAGVLALNEVRTRTKLIKVGATAALGYLRADLGHRPLGAPADRPDPQRRLLARGLGADGRLLPGRQPAVPRERLRHRHRDQPAGTGRHHPPAASGAGPPGAGHAQPLDHRGRHRRGRRRADRRQCAARPHRRLFPRHRQDAQAALLHREPGRRRPTATPTSRRR